MQDSNNREQLRHIYQQEDNGEKTFIPARPKVTNSLNAYHDFLPFWLISADNI